MEPVLQADETIAYILPHDDFTRKALTSQRENFRILSTTERAHRTVVCVKVDFNFLIARSCIMFGSTRAADIILNDSPLWHFALKLDDGKFNIVPLACDDDDTTAAKTISVTYDNILRLLPRPYSVVQSAASEIRISAPPYTFDIHFTEFRESTGFEVALATHRDISLKSDDPNKSSPVVSGTRRPANRGVTITRNAEVAKIRDDAGRLFVGNRESPKDAADDEAESDDVIRSSIEVTRPSDARRPRGRMDTSILTMTEPDTRGEQASSLAVATTSLVHATTQTGDNDEPILTTPHTHAGPTSAQQYLPAAEGSGMTSRKRRRSNTNGEEVEEDGNDDDQERRPAKVRATRARPTTSLRIWTWLANKMGYRAMTSPAR